MKRNSSRFLTCPAHLYLYSDAVCASVTRCVIKGKHRHVSRLRPVCTEVCLTFLRVDFLADFWALQAAADMTEQRSDPPALVQAPSCLCWTESRLETVPTANSSSAFTAHAFRSLDSAWFTSVVWRKFFKTTEIYFRFYSVGGSWSI